MLIRSRKIILIRKVDPPRDEKGRITFHKQIYHPLLKCASIILNKKGSRRSAPYYQLRMFGGN